MDKIEFIKISPTENMTILITTEVPIEKQLEIGKKIILSSNVGGEQAGFIAQPKNPRAKKALRMMAGEFCGNATLSLAAWIMEEENPQAEIGEEMKLFLEVSGEKNLVACHMKKEIKGYGGTIEMPLPNSITHRVFYLDNKEYNLPVVAFEGISHIIIEKYLWTDEPKIVAEQMAKAWAEQMPNAFGILLWDREEELLNPLVCIQGSTLIWEHGCGSGVCAIGAYMAQEKQESGFFSCYQDGGVMHAKVTMLNGKIQSILVQGHVDIVAVGIAFLD